MRDNLEFVGTLIAIGLMIWCVALVLGTEGQLGNDRTFLVESCVRLNILRAEDNVSHLADYRVFKVVLIQSLVNEPRLRGQPKIFEDRFLVQLRKAVHAKSWTPLTDCTKAINSRGAKYRPPAPIRFLDPRTGKEHFPSDYDLHPSPYSPAYAYSS